MTQMRIIEAWCAYEKPEASGFKHFKVTMAGFDMEKHPKLFSLTYFTGKVMEWSAIELENSKA